MITVQKGNTITDIMEVFKDKYLNAGWKIIEKPKTEIEDEAVNIIKNTLESKKSAQNRRKDPTSDKEIEAMAIVSNELKKRAKKVFTDGLIKE